MIKHLEDHLGKINFGWKDPSIGRNLQVVSFANTPFDGVTTYSTLGLSEQILPMGTNLIRHELIFSAYNRFNSEEIASFLSTFAESMVKDNKALLQGDCVGPSSPVILGTLLNSIFVSHPSIINKDLSVYYGSAPPTIFAWVVPIHEAEAEFIRAKGWKAFDSLLEEKDPDLWDLHRTAIV